MILSGLVYGALTETNVQELRRRSCSCSSPCCSPHFIVLQEQHGNFPASTPPPTAAPIPATPTSPHTATSAGIEQHGPLLAVSVGSHSWKEGEAILNVNINRFVITLTSSHQKIFKTCFELFVFESILLNCSGRRYQLSS